MSHRARRLWSSAVVVGVLLAALTVAGLSAAGGAPPEEPAATPALPTAPAGFAPYIHRASSAAADPVNLIFIGADPDTVSLLVQELLGWRLIPGSPMSFFIAGRARTTRWQLGADLPNGSRYHIRIQDVQAEDGQSYVLAAVHRDDTVACGHVGRGFDETRDLLGARFAEAGYPVHRVRLGNAHPGRHCDGSLTGGDGSALLVDLTPE